MVLRETKKSIVYFIPECTCNKFKMVKGKQQSTLKRINWKSSRFDANLLEEQLQWAMDHEELHELSRAIVDFIAETGKMQKEDIIENFPDYKEDQLSIAANMSMSPIVFPKRRQAPPSEFHRLKTQAYGLTDQYRKVKYADEQTEEEPPLIEE